MNTVKVFIAAIATSLLLYACEKTSPTLHKTGLNQNSKKLAVVPAGYDMGEASFSPDGHHVAFVIKKDGKTYMNYDSTKSMPYEDVGAPVFRKDQDGYAYVAHKAGKQSVVVNANEGAWYDSIGRIYFGSDGRVIYAAMKDQKWFIVSGKKESPRFTSADPTLLVSADGKHAAYIEKNSETNKSSISVCTHDLDKCIKGAGYDLLAVLATDASRARFAYLAGSDGKMKIVTVDLAQPGLIEKDGGWYEEVSLVALSEGGEHLAYLAKRGDKTVLVKDGVESLIPRFDMPLSLVVSKNGRLLVAGAVKNSIVVIVDGKAGGKGYSGIYAPSFSADGAHYAFAADRSSQHTIIVNGTAGPAFEKVVTPRFTLDGSRVVYRARQNGERFVVIADKEGRTIREHAHYDAVWDVAFSADGQYVGYGVKTGQELWWKTEKLDK